MFQTVTLRTTWPSQIILMNWNFLIISRLVKFLVCSLVFQYPRTTVHTFPRSIIKFEFNSIISFAYMALNCAVACDCASVL